MKKYFYNDGYYSVWTESEVILLSEEELESSFMNIKIFANDNEGIGLNVWTVKYLEKQLNTFIISQSEMLKPPDLIVKSLRLHNILKAVEQYLNETT